MHTQQLYEHTTGLISKYGLFANNTKLPGIFYMGLLTYLLKNREQYLEFLRW